MEPLRSQVWERLRREDGKAGLAVVLLADSLGVSSESVLEAVMSDLLDADGGDDPPIHCAPGPVLVPRRMMN